MFLNELADWCLLCVFPWVHCGFVKDGEAEMSAADVRICEEMQICGYIWHFLRVRWSPSAFKPLVVRQGSGNCVLSSAICVASFFMELTGIQTNADVQKAPSSYGNILQWVIYIAVCGSMRSTTSLRETQFWLCCVQVKMFVWVFYVSELQVYSPVCVASTHGEHSSRVEWVTSWDQLNC